MSDHRATGSNHDHAWATEAMFEYLNNSMSKTDAARFEAHLASCNDCRQDVEFERKLVSGMRERPLTEYVPHSSLNALNARIDEYEETRGSRRVRLGEGNSGKPVSTIVRSLLIGQAAAIAVLAIGLLLLASQPQVTEGYRTLSNPVAKPPAAPYLQVVFDDNLSTAELRTLLVGMNATIVRGPTGAGLFEVEIAPGSAITPANALEALRANQHVVFATLVKN